MIELEFLEPDYILSLINEDWSIDYFLELSQEELNGAVESTGITSANPIMNFTSFLFILVLMLCGLLVLILALLIKPFKARVKNKLK